MRIVIAGAHGRIARGLSHRLRGQDATVIGLIRNPDQRDDVRAAGAEPVVADLESIDAATLAQHVRGADAVVFAAGAGPGSGAARKDTVDRAGAVLLADAAQLAGVRRYLLVSSVGVDGPPPPGTDTVFAAYLRAKAAAEETIRGRDLDWTIVRPGRLTDDDPTGRVRLAPGVDRGAIAREDVAAVLAALLTAPGTAGITAGLVSGETPVARAVTELTSA
ncbi:NAD(P)H-binding protein [Frankia sp. QA3]|uniref:NAD(P)H-binding protein n=1 Tax=Frankia sp. QA3 TaxID=710111 RepID=UPI000269BB43|nr:NAD(P)H-binding protein [Frankia sp. QA3]EIV91229.1 NmrA-like family protein [Frankia sp. QA3]